MRTVNVKLQELHKGQQRIYNRLVRRDVLRCGRRFGKTILLENIGSAAAINGKKVGWFCPEYKYLIPSFDHIAETLYPVTRRASKGEKIVKLFGGGEIEFWTLDNENAGRSRSYDLAIIDEASLVKNMQVIWEQAIRPTLLDRAGNAIMAGTPKGIDDENYFYLACTQKDHGWKEHYAPSRANPLLDQEEVANLQAANPPLVYQQEYLAEFVDWAGAAFFGLQKLLVGGEPVDYPPGCDYVYATVDTAIKTGKEHDGTAVTFWALQRFGVQSWPLTVLDWDYQQIEGASLEVWLPTIFTRLEELARACRARSGSAGVWIEDKVSGSILLQQGIRHGWPVHAIDTALTNLGKSERAISISGYVHRELVKFSRYAFDKVLTYKNISRNHLLTQVTNFHIGVKDDGADDDAVDSFMYGVSIGLGNAEGF